MRAMRHRSSRASWILWPLLLIPAACSKRNLDLGDGTGRIGPSDGGPVTGTDGGPSDGPVGTADGPTLLPDARIMRLDATESGCVAAAILLPWTQTSGVAMHLSVAASSDAIAVMNRTSTQLDVRTFARDGTALGSFQFESDAQFGAYHDDRFLLVARGTTGDFAATSVGRTLMGGTRLGTATATISEHILGAIALPTDVVVLTDENFVSFAAGGGQPWSGVLGTADKDAFKTGRLYGLATQSNDVLIAWGTSTALRLAVLSNGGKVAARADDGSFFGFLGSQNASAIAYGGGLLLFDSNPVRLTQIGFDLSRQSLGQNTQLRTFYRATAQVAAITLQNRPVGFWLTVFPATDASQGVTTHQLYGCALDPANPATCVSTSLIAATGLGGYGVGGDPVAAAALPDGSGFAIAHTDVYGQSWLRMADLSCAVPSGGGP